jgi:phosphorylcholine metabolism protein LicD
MFKKKKETALFCFIFFSHALCFVLTSFLFFFFLPLYYLLLYHLYELNVYIIISILVFQTQQSNNLPNGILFQVKVAYGYTPVHDDELTINPNDIINVTRLVCRLLFVD